MRTAIRVQTQDWQTFTTVATYDQPMQAEADAFRLVQAGYHVGVSTWEHLAPHRTTDRPPGASKVWTGSDADWSIIDR